MFSKPLCTICTNHGIRRFSSIIKRSLLTDFHLELLSPNTNLLVQRFEGTTSSPPRTLVRQDPGAVRLGFIPDEWFTFFFPKTGVSGLGTFTFTVSIYLMSKEYLVMEHEYYGGLSMAILCILATKYIGPGIANYIDKDLDEYEKSWTNMRDYNQNTLANAIENEKRIQWQNDGQLELVKAKRENVHLQLETAYRQRLMQVYRLVKKQLDFCVQRQEMERVILKRHMASWVINEVGKSLTPDIEKDVIDNCIKDLQKLSEKFEGLVTSPYPDQLGEDEDDPLPTPPPPPPSKPKKK